MRRFIIRTANDLKKFLKVMNNKVFAFDTETTSLKYTELQLEGISLSDGRVSCYIFFADYDKQIFNENASELKYIIYELFNNAELIIAHNIVYDLKVFKKEGLMKGEPELYCTMVAQHLLNENEQSIGLKQLSEKYLGKKVTKYVDIKDHSSKEFFVYACHDAEWAYELFKLQLPELKAQGLEKLFREVEMPFQWVLVDMESTGMLVDVEKLKSTAKVIEKDIEILHNKLIELAGEEINFNSSQQLGKLLFEKLKLPVIDTTPAGKPSVGASSMLKLKGQHEIIDVLLEYKQARKLLSSYFGDNAQIMSNIEKDGRVRPSFRDVGTATGRLSCNSPNLQQLPRPDKDPYNTRDVFIVPDGYTMITCDYSGQEVAVAAQVSQDPTLVDALNKGQDMHLRIANQFYNLNIPDECLFQTHPKYKEYKKKFKAERTKAKTITFGLMYGKGAYGFSKDFGITEDEAQQIVDKYFASMPKLKESIDRAHEQVRKNGFVTNLAGRRRRFKQVEKNGFKYYPNGAYRQAYNFLIQSFSAEMIRMAMIEVRNEAKRNSIWNLTAIGTVHDEAIYQVKSEFKDVAAETIKKCFERIVNFVVPVKGEIGMGKSYYEAK